MHVRILIFTAVLSAGCSTVETNRQPPATDTDRPTFFEKMSKAAAPVRGSWQRVTKTKPQIETPKWDWESALPGGAVRSEIVTPNMPSQVAAHFAPQLQSQRFRLASTGHGNPPPVRLVNIEGHEVRNCADMYLAAERSLEEGKSVQVDLADEYGEVAAIEIKPETLVALMQTVAPEVPLMRNAEGGNSWLIIREQGVRCKLMARIERSRGLLQLGVSLVNCWGPPVLLPIEVRATCDGQSLRCLTVAETLELLYGDPRQYWQPATEASYSFAAVAERDEYLLPTNYKRLQQETDELFRRSTTPPPVPALASLPGVVYPGPAILGDARALSGFLLQRRLYQADRPEQTGWIMYAGQSLHQGTELEIDIDLGFGPHRYQLRVPAS